MGTGEFGFSLGVLDRKFEFVESETGVAIVAKEPLYPGDTFWDPTASQLSVKPVDAAPGSCLTLDIGALRTASFALAPLDGSDSGPFALSYFIDTTDEGFNARFVTRGDGRTFCVLGIAILADVATGAKVLVGRDNMRKKRPVPEAWSSDEEEAPPSKKKKPASKKRKSAEADVEAPAHKKARRLTRKDLMPSPAKRKKTAARGKAIFAKRRRAGGA